MIEQDGFPTVDDGADVEHVEKDADCKLVLVRDLIEVWLCHGQCLAEELNVIPRIEGWARD